MRQQRQSDPTWGVERVWIGACSALALDEQRDLLFVASYTSGNVTVVESQTLAVVARVFVGQGPSGLAVIPGTQHVGVANQRDDTVAFLAGVPPRIETTLPVGGQPRILAMSPDGDTLYVLNSGDGSIYEVGLAPPQVRTRLTVGRPLEALAFDRLGTTGTVVYVAAGRTVTCLDSPGLRVRWVARVSRGGYTLAIDPTRHRVFVSCSGAGVVAVLDGVTGANLASVSTGRKPHGLALTRFGKGPQARPSVYVANCAAVGTLSVIDAADLTIRATVSTPSYAGALAADEKQGLLYVAHRIGNQVSVIDTASGVGVATLEVGSSPSALIIHPTTHDVFVLCSEATELSVLRIHASGP